MSVPTIAESSKIREPDGFEIFARQIMRQRNFKTLRETDEILVYENGVYKQEGITMIKEMCQEIIPKCTNRKCNEVIGVIRRRTYVSINQFDADPNSRNFNNGILYVPTGKIHPHSPDHLFRIQLPVNYDETMGPVHFMKFMMDCLPDVKNRTNAIETFASILIPDLKLEKMIMNVGEGANGKSTFLNIIETFLGSENVSNTSIHELLNDRFAASRLNGKLANIFADISRSEIEDLGQVKALISGDSINVQEKHQKSFKMQNSAKLFYACNELPEINESSHAVYRRLLLIEWNQKFSHEGSKKIDPYLIKKLTTSQELSGILNLLIKVAQKLKKNGKLTYNSKASDTQKVWSLKSDPIGKFIDSFVEQDYETNTPKVLLYERFTNWCKENSITIKSEKSFNAKISQKLNVTSSTARINGKPTKVWLGLKITEHVTDVTGVTA